jgi:3-oxoacyl-[acyl-carrier protein] reductase
MKIADKIAIITGAGSGIGRESAVMFAQEGARIVVADINDASGKETVDIINSAGGEAIFVYVDVSIPASVENLMKTARNKFNRIDILFNNAGIPHRLMPFEKIDESLWDKVFAVNVKSVFLGAKYVAPVMKEAGGGVIVNTASFAGVRPRQGSAAYSSSKAAVIALTKELALELAPNIRVNAVSPVLVDTPMLAGLAPEGADIKKVSEMMIESVPLKRIATSEDVARAALFLASDDSLMLTGTCINLDGGRGI